MFGTVFPLVCFLWEALSAKSKLIKCVPVCLCVCVGMYLCSYVWLCVCLILETLVGELLQLYDDW